MILAQSPFSAFLVFVFIVLPLLYVGRSAVHASVRAASRLLGNPLRLIARWLVNSAQALRERNRLVLLAHAREEVERSLRREFERVETVVRRDLQNYPALQGKLLEDIARMEQDYQRAGEVPPPPADWTKAVVAIGKLKPAGDGMIEKILAQVQRTVAKAHDDVVAQYRRSYQERHRILKRFLPFWRSIDLSLSRVDRSLTGLQQHAAAIDAQTQKYEQMCQQSARAEHALTVSAAAQFLVTGLLLLIAVGAGITNFNLLVQPTTVLFGADRTFGPVPIADLAAIVITLLEVAIGVVLMESLRVTHLFPRISYIKDRYRRRLFATALLALLALAGMQATLALLPLWAISPGGVFSLSLSADSPWVIFGRAALSLVVPLAIAFVAIPLEGFVHAWRGVAGALLVMALFALAFALRLLAGILRQASVMLLAVYDLIIFLPLALEHRWRARPGKGAGGSPSRAGENGEGLAEERR